MLIGEVAVDIAEGMGVVWEFLACQHNLVRMKSEKKISIVTALWTFGISAA